MSKLGRALKTSKGLTVYNVMKMARYLSNSRADLKEKAEKRYICDQLGSLELRMK